MDSLQMALKMETDAIQFYTEAAEKTKFPVGKKMFQTVAEDEKRHVEMINHIIQGLQITSQDVSPLANIKSIFERMKNDMMKKAEASPDELEAFKIAMNMEQESVDFYKKTLAGATKEKEKALLERLIQEEEEHYRIFSNTYFYLENTRSWFLWEERAIVDGGTPWA
ncbi:MAG: ferritin family protein [Nitrospirota bacterium]